MSKDKSQRPLDIEAFQRIRKWYLFALAGIAITIILAQVLIQNHLNNQLDDFRIINVAGRQRALSQKLVKEILLLKDSKNTHEGQTLHTEIKKALSKWTTSHDALQFGNDSMGLFPKNNVEIKELFHKITPHHTTMVTAVNNILKKTGELNYFTTSEYRENSSILLYNERIFLVQMDAIVNAYDQQSKRDLQNLKNKEYLLLAFSLLILVLEILFIFKPLSLQIRNTISKLIKHKSESDETAKKIKELYSEKEKSLQELQELNFVIDNAALFASAREDGSIVFISKKFIQLLNSTSKDLKKPLQEVLTKDGGQQKYLAEILKGNRRNSIRNEEIAITTRENKTIWLAMSIVPMHQSSQQQSILILCSDITERKKHALQVDKLTKEKFEEKILQKKRQASQIVEGQEEERKRIAKDIHDGIGQMLTALKFNIESIDIENKDKTIEKIAYLKELTRDLIKGVRTATFNLTPPELSDHGILPALQKMTSELSKLTGKNILFDSKVENNLRFDSLAETNIYRVTQEAINNAIKYAESNYILLTINYTDNILSVVIDDDGKGFNPAILKEAPKNSSEGGMGLFFMKERISYINGRLFINSIPEEGTRVTINYNTDKE
ncbi:type IV pili methyl-accepting chemotaxis transducer N-terminal domain-containing protein [uncultured Maribacter sp.]|uniref:PAS domain-containing sensor histidine kinase n=1 Tax=uncultured Maribacter sp. TaxID=431308 RepID=UPI0026218AF9|nr:type IV pili methyl-accepting chemotaxis transducer N-terminal domain-containing protein [uncultured Maribacter sp.]